MTDVTPTRTPRPVGVLVTTAVLLSVALVLALVVGAVLRTRASATANGADPVRSLDELQGRWTTVNSVRAPAPLVADVVLRVDGDRLVVETGCNTGSGQVAVEDARLVVTGQGLAVTEMGCPDEGRTAQERWVLDMLQARPRLDRSGPYLALHWGEGERYWLGLENDVR